MSAFENYGKSDDRRRGRSDLELMRCLTFVELVRAPPRICPGFGVDGHPVAEQSPRRFGEVTIHVIYGSNAIFVRRGRTTSPHILRLFLNLPQQSRTLTHRTKPRARMALTCTLTVNSRNRGDGAGKPRSIADAAHAQDKSSKPSFPAVQHLPPLFLRRTLLQAHRSSQWRLGY